ncbi:hypothetical protein [Robbsia andropogonis]|uniref:hypothetical protein n=1 Tax=Robbsia andropogonis TaxID=28092 RepID=UPI000A4CB30E|nr:hypothetical protein [Robbsia andropogonis]
MTDKYEALRREKIVQQAKNYQDSMDIIRNTFEMAGEIIRLKAENKMLRDTVSKLEQKQ